MGPGFPLQGLHGRKMRVRAFLATIFVLFVVATLAAPAAQAQSNPRIALVIGNATYRDAALATTANDAGLVAQTLQAAGFDVVGARDLDGQSLRTAFRDFLDNGSRSGAGHASHRLPFRPRRSVQWRQLFRPR